MNLVKRKINTKIYVNSTVERHPVPILGIDYRVKIIYKNIRTINLDVEKKTIKISLPNMYKKVNSSEVLDLAIDKLYEQIAKVEIERAMEKTRIMLGMAPEEYELKKMKVWGKCDNKKITINPDVVMYNRDIIDYVVLHQFCHLRYKTHSKGFMKMIEQYESRYEEYEEILKS